MKKKIEIHQVYKSENFSSHATMISISSNSYHEDECNDEYAEDIVGKLLMSILSVFIELTIMVKEKLVEITEKERKPRKADGKGRVIRITDKGATK